MDRYISPHCCVCGKFVSEFKSWICESCEGYHHESCSGDNNPGYGEYPDESAYSHCKKCTEANPELEKES